MDTCYTADNTRWFVSLSWCCKSVKQERDCFYQLQSQIQLPGVQQQVYPANLCNAVAGVHSFSAHSTSPCPLSLCTLLFHSYTALFTLGNEAVTLLVFFIVV